MGEGIREGEMERASEKENGGGRKGRRGGREMKIRGCIIGF